MSTLCSPIRLISGTSARRLLLFVVRRAFLSSIVAHLIFGARSEARGEPPGLAECPFELLSMGYKRIVVVSVNFGQSEYKCELDTGMSMSAFGTNMRGLLRRSRGYTPFATPNGIAREKNYRIGRGYIAGVALPPLDSVTCADMATYCGEKPVQLDGILGIDALRGFILQFDFDARRLRILSSVPRGCGNRTPLMRKGTIPVIRGKVGISEPLLFVLDTGGGFQLAIARSAFSDHVAGGGILQAGTAAMTTISGKSLSRIGVLNVPFYACGYSHAGLTVVDLPERELPPESFPSSMIGLEYLARYTVTFDFPGGAVYLKPGKHFNALDPLLDLMGVRLSRTGQKVTVLSVEEGSRAAAKARPGDVLVSVNGGDASTMSDAQLVRAISDRDCDRRLDFRREADGSTWWIFYPPAEKEKGNGEATKRRQLNGTGPNNLSSERPSH